MFTRGRGSARTKGRQRVVICGGGAGGLHLACRLAHRRAIEVVLVEPSDTYVWKPLLHEVAAGSLDAGSHATAYLTLAKRHGFRYCQGALEGLDRNAREVLVGPVGDAAGGELIPARRVRYDLAVIAVGAVGNDFGIEGADTALPLDTVEDAERIRRSIREACIRANYEAARDALHRVKIAIIGGGATGVELAAELREMVRALADWGLDRLDPERAVAIAILNADPRLLAQLPERISGPITKYLEAQDIAVHNGETVVRVGGEGISTKAGRRFPVDIVVWAAGIKARAITRRLDGLETNRIGQLVVHQDLRTTSDPHVLGFGDCAACPWPGHDSTVPPRAQAAHQQAGWLVAAIPRMLDGQRVEPYRYRDFGSLVSLGSERTAIGTVMGLVTGRSLRVEGLLARMAYKLLYRRHRAALFGWPAAIMESIGDWIGRATRPRIKLH